MNKWELARYLIDAKKCVDSVLYIAQNGEKLKYYGLKELIDGKRNTFYINCCSVIDKTILPRKKEERISFFRNDPILDLLFTERDKNSAHKDDEYIPQHFIDIGTIATQMEEQIIHVRELCKDYLPAEITLDFVPHDKALFRAIHKILADDEEKIINEKFPQRNCSSPNTENAQMLSILHDTLDLRSISPETRNEYCVLFNCGLNMYETLQEIQDGAIKVNLLYNQNMWCSIDQAKLEKHMELVKLGAYNEYDIPQPLPKDPILANIILQKIAKLEQTITNLMKD